MSNNGAIQALTDMVRGEISGIHTSAPGKIVSYDSGTGRASVQPSLKFKVADGRSLDSPVIVNVPVYFPSGAGASITYPIAAGDPCWLVFAERSIDDWLLGGESEDPRKYDLTDCVAFVGMKPTRSTNNNAIEITNGGCTVSIPSGGPVSINTDVIINGISFLQHVHGSVQPGSGNTSTPE
jgi:hypothetical protein